MVPTRVVLNISWAVKDTLKLAETRRHEPVPELVQSARPTRRRDTGIRERRQRLVAARGKGSVAGDEREPRLARAALHATTRALWDAHVGLRALHPARAWIVVPAVPISLQRPHRVGAALVGPGAHRGRVRIKKGSLKKLSLFWRTVRHDDRALRHHAGRASRQHAHPHRLTPVSPAD